MSVSRTLLDPVPVEVDGEVLLGFARADPQRFLRYLVADYEASASPWPSFKSSGHGRWSCPPPWWHMSEV